MVSISLCSCSIFSIKFSPDNREILGGSSDASLYLYDIERQKRILCVPGHDDDVNTVAFADSQSQIFITGSDDTSCKVWDRRLLQDKKRQNPVGIFCGHYEGITWVDAKGDGRYFISNGKDQCCRLWDIRKMAPECKMRGGTSRNNRSWDYRWESYPYWTQSAKKKEADTSLMTYRGHSVLETLIRCYFSPAATTGQRYIVTGSQCGSVHIYDILTGKIVKKFPAHRGTVRDVSWHPYQTLLMTSSWDNTLGRWEYKEDIVTSESSASSSSSAASSSLADGNSSPSTSTTTIPQIFISTQERKNDEEEEDEEEREILYAMVRSLHGSATRASSSSTSSDTTSTTTTATLSIDDLMDTSDDSRRGRRRRRTEENDKET